MKLTSLIATSAAVSFAVGANAQQLRAGIPKERGADFKLTKLKLTEPKLAERKHTELKPTERKLGWDDYDCEWKGQYYYDGDWAYDSGAKYDKCQCKWNGNWGNCKNVNCNECEYDNDYEWCVDEGYCSDDCDECKNHKSPGWCQSNGYCDWDDGYDNCNHCESNNGYEWCVDEGYCSDDCDECENHKSSGWCESNGYCDWNGGDEWDVNMGHACRTGDWRKPKGEEDHDYRVYKNKSFDWCKGKCKDDHECKGFEHSNGGRCEIWWNYYGDVERKSGVHCFWKD